MKAWLLDAQTGLGALRRGEVADPQPGPGEVRLRVRYAALNPADRYLAEKQYPAKPTFPHILGRDAMGVVDQLGAGADKWPVGQRVAILRGEAGVNRPGTLADYVCVPQELLVPVPEGWTEQQAAAAPLVYLTAWQALTMWSDDTAAGVAPDSVVLVTGVSGGVGLAAAHLAKAMGARVVGVSRGLDKVVALHAQGVDLVVDPSSEEFVASVRAFAGRAGVALAVDNIGGPLLPRVLETMGNNGRVSVVGRLGGPVPEFNTASLFFRRLRIGGVAVGAYSADEAQAAWRRVLEALGRTGRQPLVDSVHAFEDVVAAFDRLKQGPLGKVLVKVGDPLSA